MHPPFLFKLQLIAKVDKLISKSKNINLILLKWLKMWTTGTLPLKQPTPVNKFNKKRKTFVKKSALIESFAQSKCPICIMIDEADGLSKFAVNFIVKYLTGVPSNKRKYFEEN